MNEIISLSEIEAFDARPLTMGSERRFLCLSCGASKPRDDAHRSFSLNRNTGAFICHRCGVKGLIKDNWKSHQPTNRRARTQAALKTVFTPPRIVQPPPEKQNAIEVAREFWHESKPLENSIAAAYIEKRGISLSVATSANVRFHPAFYNKRPAVLFPLYDSQGELVAVNGRFVDNKERDGKSLKTQSAGPKSFGLFSSPNALQSDCVAVCEAAFDALSLWQCGIPALAMTGTSFPEWLPRKLAFRSIVLATDADAPGDESSNKLIHALRPLGAKTTRLRPIHGKDWSEILERWGENEIRFQFNNFLPSDNQIEDYPAEWKQLTEFLSLDELDAMLDAIREREAFLIYEGCASSEALGIAESEVFLSKQDVF